MRIASSRSLVTLALVLSLGVGALFARAILTIRDDQWAYARHINSTLAHTIEQNIARTVSGFDHSLAGVVNTLGQYDLQAIPPGMRHALLFDHSLRTRGLGSVAVLDANGDVVLDSEYAAPRKINLADREYFRAHLRDGYQGLYIGAPIRSRLADGAHSLPMSRAYFHSDGSFAGVVVGAIRIEYFKELFASVDLGAMSRIDLWRHDGSAVAQFPAGPQEPALLDAQHLARLNASGHGTFTGPDVQDGERRLHAFRHVDGYPLIVSVGQSVDTILAQWRRSALVLGGFALLLMACGVGLTQLFARELRRRQDIGTQLKQAEHDLRTILNNLPSFVGYWDRGLRNRFANQAYQDWLGVSAEQLRAQQLPEIVGEPTYGQIRSHVERALEGQRQTYERSVRMPSGQECHLQVSYVPDVEDAQVQGFFVQIDDLTERKHMEDLLFEEKEMVRLTLQSIGDAVICTDARGHVTYLNPMAELATGWQAFDAADRHVDEVAPLQMPAHQGDASSSVVRALAGSGAASQRGLVLRRRDGRLVDIEESASPITDRHGQVTGAVIVLRDVTEAMALSRRMAHLAQHDVLTNLPNRVLLQDRAQQAMAHAKRDGHTLALLYLDLDGFKQVNDTLGHDAGDLLLVQVAQRLTAAVRGSDTVCRQGGDEFVVLLPALDTAEQACVVARKMMAACEAPFDLRGRAVRIGLSGGIALYPGPGQTFEELARCADTAMYAAKRNGRSQFRLYVGADAEPERVPASA